MRFNEYIGKTIFITGAGSGIGQAQAISFFRKWCECVWNGSSGKRITGTCKEI